MSDPGVYHHLPLPLSVRHHPEGVKAQLYRRTGRARAEQITWPVGSSEDPQLRYLPVRCWPTVRSVRGSVQPHEGTSDGPSPPDGAVGTRRSAASSSWRSQPGRRYVAGRGNSPAVDTPSGRQSPS